MHDIVKDFVKQGIPILPIHDSFLVQKSQEDLLISTMADKFVTRFLPNRPSAIVNMKHKEFVDGVEIERKIRQEGINEDYKE